MIIILGNCPCGSFFLQIDVRSSIFLQIVVPDKYLKNHDNLLFNWLLLFIFPSSQILQIVVVVNFSKMVVLDIFPNLSIYCCGFSQIDNREKLFYYYLFQIEYFCKLFFNTNFLQFLQIVVPDQIIETSRDVIPVAYKRASKVKVGQYSV